MSTVYVRTGEVSVPAICVACGAPAAMPGSAEYSLLVGSQTQAGNTVRTTSISLPLCLECAGARKHRDERESDYPGVWWARGAAALAVAAGVGWVAAVNKFPDSPLAYGSCAAFFVVLVTAIALPKLLRSRNERVNPMSEDEVARLDLMARAVVVSPSVVDPGIVGLTFNNEYFGQAFAAANPSAEAWGLTLGT